jgi:uncharacterized protein (DUF2126 family)
VKLSGVATEGRYVVACNGRRVPLTPTGTPGEAIAGVRYRARRLSKTLHPTIPVHAPLVFDLIDTWASSANGKCVAQCTYFVGHPQGSLYNGRPANAEEAEARRSERFQVAQTLPTEVAIPAPETNPIFPMTLDLRLPLARKTLEYVALGPVDGAISEPAT